MPVIDIDSHFEPTDDWLDEFPALKARLPERFPTDDPRFTIRSPEMFAYFVTDDLLRGAPPEKRMSIDRLVTPHMRNLYDPDRGPEAGYPGSNQHMPFQDTAGRLAWMDEQGIDVQNVICAVAYTLARAIQDPALGMEALEAANTWMSDRTGETGGRLMTAATLRYEDLDWAIRELGRMRERGSRTFMLPSEPVAGTPPSHRNYDRFWSAVVDLGMVPIVHVGQSPALFHPAWANTDNPALVRVLSVSQPTQQAQVMLTSLVLDGVFERHPRLTVVIAEHGIDWIKPLVDRLDLLSAPGISPLLMGDYELPMAPGEYVRRNVRVTPLPHAHETPVPTIDALPEIPIFSSDYPHFEGNPDPMGHYATELSAVPEERRAAFFGENVAECFARTGDPIHV